MSLLQLALIGYGVVLAVVPTAVVGGVVARRLRGDRWEVPLEWTPDLEGILSRPPGQPEVVAARATARRTTRTNETDPGLMPAAPI